MASCLQFIPFFFYIFRFFIRNNFPIFLPTPDWHPGHHTICLTPVDLHLVYPWPQQKYVHILWNILYAKVHLQASCIKIHPHWRFSNILLNDVTILSPILGCQIYHVRTIRSILSSIFYAIYRAWCFQPTHLSCDDRENMRTWYHYPIRSKVRIIFHCLRLGHETRVCFMSTFLYDWPVDSMRKTPPFHCAASYRT